MGNDIFNRVQQDIKVPFTADKCLIEWDGNVVSEAFQVQATYGQQVTRRRSIGNKDVVIYGSQPQGQIQVGRLLVKDLDVQKLFGGDSFKCGKGYINLYTGGACDPSTGQGNLQYSITGCIVTNYSVSMNAEDLTVVDNLTIEFMQMFIVGG